MDWLESKLVRSCRLTHRRFGEGNKVAVEIPMSTTEAGYNSIEENDVSVIRWETKGDSAGKKRLILRVGNKNMS